MRVSIVNLGCKVNRVESDSIALFYERSGDELSDVEHADLVVVNTCTVTGEAEKKTRKTIRRVLRSNESARVVVTGCASAIDPGFFSALSPRISVVDKVDLMEECESLGASSRDDLVRVGERFPSRVAVKIQDGCNHACTYCIVHVARGRARSRKYAQVEQEIMGLAKAGAKEIVLAGIDLGSYRGEVDGEPFRLGGLVSRLLACLESEGFPEVRLRISSIEPRSIDEDFISVLASSNGRVCRHLHIPLQSGSDRRSNPRRDASPLYVASLPCSRGENSRSMPVAFPYDRRDRRIPRGNRRRFRGHASRMSAGGLFEDPCVSLLSSRFNACGST